MIYNSFNRKIYKIIILLNLIILIKMTIAINNLKIISMMVKTRKNYNIIIKAMIFKENQETFIILHKMLLDKWPNKHITILFMVQKDNSIL